MGRLAGTETEKNILAAFTEEAESLVKYVIFSENTEYAELRETWKDIANHEMEHAEAFLKLLYEIDNDKSNVEQSIALEGYVSAVDYPSSAEVARAEGFEDVALVFERIAAIEARHKKIFSLLKNRIESGDFFSGGRIWMCTECGYIVTGSEPPDFCPVCNHPKKDFKLYKEV